jgi:hypothetical protein
LIQGNIIAGNAGNVCGYSAIGIFSLEDTGIQIVRNVVSANASFRIPLAYRGGNALISQNTITQNYGVGFKKQQCIRRFKTSELILSAVR